MIEITGTDSEPHVFKTAHGDITVTIINGRLHLSCGMNQLAVLPRADNSISIHVARTDKLFRLYEPG